MKIVTFFYTITFPRISPMALLNLLNIDIYNGYHIVNMVSSDQYLYSFEYHKLMCLLECFFMKTMKLYTQKN